jgi:2-oxoglutarate ferredoxin oxidoreductase subunit alpha
VVNVQRGGPSTGLPTKTEQSDLMQTLYGRNGESPVVVVAASTPSDCFHYAYMSAKIALERMVPVVLLTDGFLGNGTEPWKVTLLADLPPITPRFATDVTTYKPYKRDPKTLAREWAFPGMEGFQHRIGGLEKDAAGNVSHDPANHQLMCEIRRDKVEAVVDMLPLLEVVGETSGDLLVVGWGGTLGHLDTAVRDLQTKGTKVSLAHFNYIKPLPANTAEVFSKFDKIVVCELNLGQFVGYLRDKMPDYKYHQFNKVQGLPFTIHELSAHFLKLIAE